MSQSVPAMDRWSHYQLVYHGDQDLALRRMVRPLLRELVEVGLIDRFFFVRYQLGGPHLRLRWRRASAAADDPGAIEGRLARHARRFFRQHPSGESWPLEKIRRVNRQLVRRPAEVFADEVFADEVFADEVFADEIFADESWHRAELGLEEERYGGRERIPDALDLFTLSSLRSLGFLERRDRRAAGFRTAVVAEMLSSAFALARDPDEAVGLAGYGQGFFGEPFAGCRRQAERQFAELQPGLTRLAAARARAVAAALAAGEGEEVDLDAAYWRSARRYSLRLGVPAARRWYVLASHIHMSANRLGAHNPEEAQLSRLAQLAVSQLAVSQLAVCQLAVCQLASPELRRAEPESWSALWRPGAVRAEAGRGSFDWLRRWTGEGASP